MLKTSKILFWSGFASLIVAIFFYAFLVTATAEQFTYYLTFGVVFTLVTVVLWAFTVYFLVRGDEKVNKVASADEIKKPH